MSAGLGLAALGAAAVVQAQPAPFPDYHWCPGQGWNQAWGGNWDGGRCHDDHWYDGEYRDQGHWHNGPYDGQWQGGNPGQWQGGNPGQWQGGNPYDQGHWH